jgi:hypothetical protein
MSWRNCDAAIPVGDIMERGVVVVIVVQEWQIADYEDGEQHVLGCLPTFADSLSSC